MAALAICFINNSTSPFHLFFHSHKSQTYLMMQEE